MTSEDQPSYEFQAAAPPDAPALDGALPHGPAPSAPPGRLPTLPLRHRRHLRRRRRRRRSPRRHPPLPPRTGQPGHRATTRCPPCPRPRRTRRLHRRRARHRATGQRRHPPSGSVCRLTKAEHPRRTRCVPVPRYARQRRPSPPRRRLAPTRHCPGSDRPRRVPSTPSEPFRPRTDPPTIQRRPRYPRQTWRAGHRPPPAHGRPRRRPGPGPHHSPPIRICPRPRCRAVRPAAHLASSRPPVGGPPCSTRRRSRRRPRTTTRPWFPRRPRCRCPNRRPSRYPPPLRRRPPHRRPCPSPPRPARHAAARHHPDIASRTPHPSLRHPRTTRTRIADRRWMRPHHRSGRSPRSPASPRPTDSAPAPSTYPSSSPSHASTVAHRHRRLHQRSMRRRRLSRLRRPRPHLPRHQPPRRFRPRHRQLRSSPHLAQRSAAAARCRSSVTSSARHQTPPRRREPRDHSLPPAVTPRSPIRAVRCPTHTPPLPLLRHRRHRTPPRQAVNRIRWRTSIPKPARRWESSSAW